MSRSNIVKTVLLGVLFAGYILYSRLKSPEVPFAQNVQEENEGVLKKSYIRFQFNLFETGNIREVI